MIFVCFVNPHFIQQRPELVFPDAALREHDLPDDSGQQTSRCGIALVRERGLVRHAERFARDTLLEISARHISDCKRPILTDRCDLGRSAFSPSVDGMAIHVDRGSNAEFRPLLEQVLGSLQHVALAAVSACRVRRAQQLG